VVLDRRAERQLDRGGLPRAEAGDELAVEGLADERRAMLPRGRRAT
jgi:hypothetical protein